MTTRNNSHQGESPDTLYKMIGKETVRMNITKSPAMKSELQVRIYAMCRAVVKILEANKQ